MKTISVYVDEQQYAALKALAAEAGRPVAELIREAMQQMVAEAKSQRSMRDLPPRRSGRVRGPGARHGLLDEMRER